MKYFMAVLFCVLFAAPVFATDQIAKFGWTRSPESIVTGYQIYRATTSSGPYEAVGDIVPQVEEGVEVTSQDTVPYVPGNSYYYIVRARAAKATSGDSNEVNVVSLSVPVLHVKVQVIVDVQ